MLAFSNVLRPKSIDDFLGQSHFFYKGSLLYNSIINKTFTSAIFFGKSGTGKTTLSRIIAKEMDADYVEINASETGTAELKKILKTSEDKFLSLEKKRTFLYIDEFHRWNKLQQDSLLKALEEGFINFIGSTTENPFFSINNAILSRVGRIYEFKKLTNEEVATGLKNAIKSENGFAKYNANISDENVNLIAEFANGDLRVAIDSLGFILTNIPEGSEITKENIEEAFQRKTFFYDNKEDKYNLLSALQKSIRGSDPDAALYYLANLIEGGEKIEVIGRRLLVIASEDVSMAYPNALSVAYAGVRASEMTGFPEARIHLAFITVFLCSLPKTNAALVAYDSAAHDIRENGFKGVPDFLKDGHYKGAEKLGRAKGYINPHSNNGKPSQRYLPEELLEIGKKYYFPKDIGFEKNFKNYLENIWK